MTDRKGDMRAKQTLAIRIKAISTAQIVSQDDCPGLRSRARSIGARARNCLQKRSPKREDAFWRTASSRRPDESFISSSNLRSKEDRRTVMQSNQIQSCGGRDHEAARNTTYLKKTTKMKRKRPPPSRSLTLQLRDLQRQQKQ
jgi:hypothetical protein